ncbi:predicted protein [Uncinocarpus reesii 1704]|uniref:BTB domain-containing protein n=1 Tax=Uncinocarpus reesii (strain UAMH 1704) TaxID=336963 RepID=C4JW39_UNCRE|nr:uncharacterized protein UREG_06781 [Uncinocarpus reesii 1704]EEP81916.1 predicted protein [Uncinocarpus reesii 1704]
MDSEAPGRARRLLQQLSESDRPIAVHFHKSRVRGNFTDLTLICEGKRLAVHRLVESFSGEFVMKEDSLLLVEKLIDYLYTTDYEDVVKEIDDHLNESPSILQVNARMFALGDKYDVGGLCDLSAAKYARRLNQPVDGVEYLESVPDVYNLTATVVKPLKHLGPANCVRGFLPRPPNS